MIRYFLLFILPLCAVAQTWPEGETVTLSRTYRGAMNLPVLGSTGNNGPWWRDGVWHIRVSNTNHPQSNPLETVASVTSYSSGIQSVEIIDPGFRLTESEYIAEYPESGLTNWDYHDVAIIRVIFEEGAGPNPEPPDPSEVTPDFGDFDGTFFEGSMQITNNEDATGYFGVWAVDDTTGEILYTQQIWEIPAGETVTVDYSLPEQDGVTYQYGIADPSTVRQWSYDGIDYYEAERLDDPEPEDDPVEYNVVPGTSVSRTPTPKDTRPDVAAAGPTEGETVAAGTDVSDTIPADEYETEESPWAGIGAVSLPSAPTFPDFTANSQIVLPLPVALFGVDQIVLDFSEFSVQIGIFRALFAIGFTLFLWFAYMELIRKSVS